MCVHVCAYAHAHGPCVLHVHVAQVKPVSTIGRAQTTATFGGDGVVLEAKGRHDPCVLPTLTHSPGTYAHLAPISCRSSRRGLLRVCGGRCVLPRTPPLVEGMAALVLIDAALMQRTRLGGSCTTVSDARQNFEPMQVHAHGHVHGHVHVHVPCATVWSRCR